MLRIRALGRHAAPLARRTVTPALFVRTNQQGPAAQSGMFDALDAERRRLENAVADAYSAADTARQVAEDARAHATEREKVSARAEAALARERGSREAAEQALAARDVAARAHEEASWRRRHARAPYRTR